MVDEKILTHRERQIISKKINGGSLTQNESNILSKSIRPKLREISMINAGVLLDKLDYNQKGKAIEGKIKKIIVENVENIENIVIYGSAIQTNYKNYKDIDIIVITKNKIWKDLGEKYNLINKLTEMAKKIDINLDIQLIDKKSFYSSYPSSPSLIYQLKDSKTIYGKRLRLGKTGLTKLDLRMKLDWSDVDKDASNDEIYQSLRNLLLVRLLLKGKIDNNLLKEEVLRKIGEEMINKIKNNHASKVERRMALNYIKELSDKTDKEIKEAKWEKIVL